MAGISGIDMNTFYGGLTSQGVGTLFGSLGKTSGVSSLSGIVSDYRTIQTGTYGKLLKSYYGQDTHSAKSAASKSTARAVSKKTSSELKSSLSNVKSKMDKLNESASALADTGKDSIFAKKSIKQSDGTTKEDYDVNAIYSAVNKFVGNYNDAVDAASSSTNYSVYNGARSLSSTTNVMTNQLKGFGITTDVNGKMSVDEDTFKASDMSKFQKLMNGRQSYASNIAQTATRISGTSNNKLSSLSASTYGRSGGYQASDLSSSFSSYF